MLTWLKKFLAQLRAQKVHPISLAKLAGQLRRDDTDLPVCALQQAEVDGRTEFLAVQGAARQVKK